VERVENIISTLTTLSISQIYDAVMIIPRNQPYVGLEYPFVM